MRSRYRRVATPLKVHAPAAGVIESDCVNVAMRPLYELEIEIVRRSSSPAHGPVTVIEAMQVAPMASRSHVAGEQAECEQVDAGEPVSSPSARTSMLLEGAGQSGELAPPAVQTTS